MNTKPLYDSFNKLDGCSVFSAILFTQSIQLHLLRFIQFVHEPLPPKCYQLHEM